MRVSLVVLAVTINPFAFVLALLFLELARKSFALLLEIKESGKQEQSFHVNRIEIFIVEVFGLAGLGCAISALLLMNGVDMSAMTLALVSISIVFGTSLLSLIFRSIPESNMKIIQKDLLRTYPLEIETPFLSKGKRKITVERLIEEVKKEQDISKIEGASELLDRIKDSKDFATLKKYGKKHL